jgi:acetyl-CoA synthetase
MYGSLGVRILTGWVQSDIFRSCRYWTSAAISCPPQIAMLENSNREVIMKNHQNNIQSGTDLNQHWTDISKRLDWISPYTKLHEVSYEKPVSIKWYLNGKLNVSVNCIDRHLPDHANDVAFIFEPDDVSEASKKVTYMELHREVCKMANILKKHNVKKHDVVTIYMPMIPETVYAMLACARIGAVHSVVFGGFSPTSLADRINDCKSNFVITANEGLRGGKPIPLKSNVDESLLNTNFVKNTLVISRTKNPWVKNAIDLVYEDEIQTVDSSCPAEIMDSEDPLFILYTSGSTGKPKGVLHTTAGYLAYASWTHEVVFNYQRGQIYWCTADVGWVTGHSYIVYGPLCNGATSLIFEGVPNYPTVSRFWNVIDKHQVEIFYTAPTAIRSLMREGLDFLKTTSLKSLKVLGSVGEPINPEAWEWYSKYVGQDRCPVVDTWWQTETGGILISDTAKGKLPSRQKPGSATKPLTGIFAQVLSSEGEILHGEATGVLVFEKSWPGQMRSLYGDHARFEEAYFSTYPGYYFTGDGCRRDGDGDFWITGRMDDVMNISGHRIGTAEVESALITHQSVAESAVVAFPHDLKGHGIYAYVTLKSGIEPTEDLKAELRQAVRKVIGPIATPDKIQWANALPKTRSGKIMRRILRKIAENQIDSLGDVSTLADPSVVESLILNRL